MRAVGGGAAVAPRAAPTRARRRDPRPRRGLARVHAHVSTALADAGGWEPERRRFRPHITLVRIGRGALAARGSRDDRSRREPQPQPLPATPRLDFAPEAIVLYRSWLDPAGASYEPLARSELAPAAR